jgi:hypothetical protein
MYSTVEHCTTLRRLQQRTAPHHVGYSKAQHHVMEVQQSSALRYVEYCRARHIISGTGADQACNITQHPSSPYLHSLMHCWAAREFEIVQYTTTIKLLKFTFSITVGNIFIQPWTAPHTVYKTGSTVTVRYVTLRNVVQYKRECEHCYRTL